MVHCHILGSQFRFTSLQRQVHLGSPHGNFWDQVDKTLDSIKSVSRTRDLGMSLLPGLILVAHFTSHPVISRQF